MTITHLQSHRDSAAYLFRRRQSMLAAPEIEGAAVARLERHLRMHLHVLGRSPMQKSEPKKPAEVFALLAAELDSPVEERRTSGVDLACRWLSEGGAKGEGAFWAMALFPPPAADPLLDLFRRFSPLRPVLFRLWREQGAPVPADLLNPEDIASWDTALQEAALGYAADCSAIGALFFRPFWRPLLEKSSSLPSGVAAAALRGALLRGEADVPSAAQGGMERETDPERQIPFARLGAMTGDPAFLPPLRSFCAAHPREGVSLLPLHGTAEAAELLLEHLPHVPQEGGRAWTRLTGEKLPAGSDGEMTEGARRWWEANRQGWREGERRAFGQALSAQVLASLARQTSGEAGRNLFDQLSAFRRRPLECTSDAWQGRREEVLRRASEPEAAIEQRRGKRLA